ncbi:AraC family transcriptional regulator [Rhizobium leguminosarum bv. trifolii]|uniref:AraC family transcriptional regulator n=1 Tax=Rhizobium leguminosarum TaxID=384 RepID=UPI000E2FA0C6|nr:AraC family transcriptional regulator [Rhizobium leguminosarum]RFB88830.1 AraC family transcriptional regulator [Rhizobium leguminosarum bv. trifolii]
MLENVASAFAPRFSGCCFDEMVETYAGLSCPFEASPIGPAQNFLWKADVWSDDILTLATGQYQGAWHGRSAPKSPESLLIVLPRSGAVTVNLGRSTAESVPGQMLLINNHEAERFVVTGEHHLSDVLRVNWSVIAQVVSALLETPLNGSLELTPMVNLSAQPGKLIGHLLETIAMGMRDNGVLLRSPIAMSHLTQTLTDMLIRLIPHRFSSNLNNNFPMIAPRSVRRAIDFMQVNISRPITMQMVADAAGVSLRALEKGFNTFKETTPAAYLRAMRLRAVRQDLLDPSNKQLVSEICLKWGFVHFGRFSATYRATYGENPSETKVTARIMLE